MTFDQMCTHTWTVWRPKKIFSQLEKERMLWRQVVEAAAAKVRYAMTDSWLGLNQQAYLNTSHRVPAPTPTDYVMIISGSRIKDHLSGFKDQGSG